MPPPPPTFDASGRRRPGRHEPVESDAAGRFAGAGILRRHPDPLQGARGSQGACANCARNVRVAAPHALRQGVEMPVRPPPERVLGRVNAASSRSAASPSTCMQSLRSGGVGPACILHRRAPLRGPRQLPRKSVRHISTHRLKYVRHFSTHRLKYVRHFSTHRRKAVRHLPSLAALPSAALAPASRGATPGSGAQTRSRPLSRPRRCCAYRTVTLRSRPTGTLVPAPSA